MGYEVELRVRKVEERLVEKEERVYGIVEEKGFMCMNGVKKWRY